jgi:hypothetical protein
MAARVSGGGTHAGDQSDPPSPGPTLPGRPRQRSGHQPVEPPQIWLRNDTDSSSPETKLALAPGGIHGRTTGAGTPVGRDGDSRFVLKGACLYRFSKLGMDAAYEDGRR